MSDYTAETPARCPKCGGALTERTGRSMGEVVYMYDCDHCDWDDEYARADRLTVATAPWSRDLWAEVERVRAAVADNHKAVDYYGDVAERAETERSNARDELLRMTAERDAALAEVERLRAVAQPVVSERPALRWKLSLIGTWALCLQPGDWLSGAYIAFHHGAAMAYAADGAAFGRSERLANLEAAVSRIATWAREDGYHVPPHPLGWDIGEAPRA